MRAFAGLETYESSRPLGPWLRRIVSNSAADHFRRERRFASAAQFDDSGGWQEMRVADSELTEAVAALSDDKRTVVVLHYWCDLSIEAIADSLSIPSGTVMSRLARALTVLRKNMEQTRVDG